MTGSTHNPDAFRESVAEAVRFNWVRPDPWLNGWGALPGYPVAFTKTSDGLLLLRGLAVGPVSSGVRLFQLPSWAAPAQQAYLSTFAWNGGPVPVGVRVDTNGAVVLLGTVAGFQWLTLDGLVCALQPVY